MYEDKVQTVLIGDVRMKKAIIIGNCGSGKSRFAKALSKKTGLPLVHLDKLLWRGEWETVEREEFDRQLQSALEEPRWIIDGNYNRTIPHRLKYCDTVFFFDLPTVVCLWGSIERVIRNYGKIREDMGGNCTERFDKNKLLLCRNIIGFNRQHRKKYYEMLAGADGVNVVVFRSRRQADEYINSI